jgi:3-hydroxyisobutyrate dehydrogenase-like beta-hydroxyacid dehydrogenase
MGRAMVPRLIAAGFPVAVWNRSERPLAEMAALGAAPMATPAALTAAADVVITMLTDDAAVDAVYAGERGLIRAPAPGRLFVEMSTILPATVQRLAAAARRQGAALIDAPVSGTVGPAREGRLLILCGGEAADLDRARPALLPLARRIVHLGPTGSGTVMKLVLNLPMAVWWQGLAEALALGSRSGLAVATMLDLIADSPAAIAALPAKMKVLLGEESEVAFDIAGVRKDLAAMTAAGRAVDVAMPAGEGAVAGFTAAVAAGWGARDLAAIAAFARRREGTAREDDQAGGGAPTG